MSHLIQNNVILETFILPSQSLGLALKNKIWHNKSKHASATKYTTTQNEH